jgi:hypothetical protein
MCKWLLQAEVELVMPLAVGDYTDFYCSREHAENVGAMFRGKDNALPANWCAPWLVTEQACELFQFDQGVHAHDESMVLTKSFASIGG